MTPSLFEKAPIHARMLSAAFSSSMRPNRLATAPGRFVGFEARGFSTHTRTCLGEEFWARGLGLRSLGVYTWYTSGFVRVILAQGPWLIFSVSFHLYQGFRIRSLGVCRVSGFGVWGY